MNIPFPTLPEPTKRRGRGSTPRPQPVPEAVVIPLVPAIEIPKEPVKIVPKSIDNSPVVIEEVVYQPPPKLEEPEPAKKDMGDYTVEKVEW